MLENSHHEQLSLCFSAEGITNPLWSIPDTKSPALDGYNSKFYKAFWSVIGDDVVEVVQQFFRYGKHLQAWNTTAVHLIPKVPNPNNSGDYRPISCCHTLYKCITKLICSRLKLVLGHIISPSQGAFVEGRNIMHNILLCQDIVKQYGRKHYPPSSLLKIDLRKAYDTLEWDFIKDMLISFNFPSNFINIVMTCISTA